MATKTANVTARIQLEIKEYAETFDRMMEKGLKQARENEALSLEETFEKLKAGI